jgi:predicted dehydrogenase
MAARPTTIALAGLGAAARQIHLPAYRKIPGLRVVGGTDPAGAPPGFPAPFFDSVEAMLESTRPDLLAVLSPPSTHAELVRAGLEQGCHIFCEKPLSPVLEEAAALVRLAEERGRHLVVNQEFRYMEQHRAVADLLGGNDFGDLLFLDARQTFRTEAETEAGWRGQETRRTGQEFGIHVLDLCRYFFGEEPTTLYARMPRPGGGPDYLNLVQLEFPGERAAQITLDRLTRGPHRYLELRLDGTAGTVETRLGGGVELRGGLAGKRPFLELDVAGGGRSRLYHGERFRTVCKDPLDLFPSATAALLQAALDAIEAGEEPPCGGADNLRSLALVLAAYESDALRRPLRFHWEPVPRWEPLP